MRMLSKHGWACAMIVAGCAVLTSPHSACADGGAEADTARDEITIDYPDRLEVAVLADYVSQTLNLRILYGEEIKNQNVILRPGTVTLPKAKLLDLLRSVLAVKGLALIDDPTETFYRIVPIANAAKLTGRIRTSPPIEPQSGRIITQLIRIPSGDLKRVVGTVQSFVSGGSASIIELPEQRSILLTDDETNIARVLDLIKLIDQPSAPIVTETVHVQHQPVPRLMKYVSDLLPAEAGTSGDAAPARLSAGLSPGSIVIQGTDSAVWQAAILLRRFDVPTHSDSTSETYSLKHSSADRIKSLIESLVASTGEGAMQIHVDESVNRLYVSASPAQHRRIAELLEREDVPAPASAKRTRIYRPQNRPASEILDTLTQLLQDTRDVADSEQFGSGGTASTSELLTSNRLRGSGNISPPGRNRPPTPQRHGQPLPRPPAQEPIESPEDQPQPVRRITGPDYVLTEDEATNAIIAVGSPEFHNQLADLIEQLDRRPAQVLIEMTLVAVTLSDSVSLGIELEGLDLGDGFDYLLFSNFGLSSFDVATGQRVLTPGVGLNGVLIGPTEVPIILKALATHGNSRVISSPRMVVSDNTTATLRNVEEAPFTSVNASDTVATTSFAGFASAGTTLTVTPHVAQGDHLTLNYDLSFSNFSGAAGSATVPPPRTTNSFTGDVQLPDGYTVIVGGLEVENDSDTVSEIPGLGRIPIVGPLFQSSSTSRTHTRIFAFIRPVILRDDQFADLKYISTESLEAADVENEDFPQDHEMWMR